MQNIHIKRHIGESECPNQHQGSISPEDGSWRLIIDRDGVPHLMVRTNIEMENGAVTQGYFAVEDLLPDGVTIEQIMKSTFGGGSDEPDSEELSKYNSAKLYGWDNP